MLCKHLEKLPDVVNVPDVNNCLYEVSFLSKRSEFNQRKLHLSCLSGFSIRLSMNMLLSCSLAASSID